MRENLREYCLNYGREDLLTQWHISQNGDLTPEKVSFGSHKKIWWRCEHGHEWQSPAYSRAEKMQGCPYCVGKRILPGMDFRSLYPELAAQWHPTKNEPLEPTMVMAGSAKRVWWKCADGHEWKAVIYSRTRAQRCGCPVCAGKAPRIYK